MEHFIGNLPLIGVITAACIVAIGGAFYHCGRAGAVPRYGSFQGEPAFLEHVEQMMKAAASLRSEAVIPLGLLVLIAVPIFRARAAPFSYSSGGRLRARDRFLDNA
jgi:uncharacterized membrane protein